MFHEKYKKIIIYLLGILVAFSAAVFSVHQIIVGYYTSWLIVTTLLVSGITAFVIFCKTYEDVWRFIKTHKLLAIGMIVSCVMIIRIAFQNKGLICVNPIVPRWSEELFRIRWYAFSGIALVYLSILLCEYVLRLLKDIFSDLEKKEWIGYGVVSILFMILVFVIYLQNNMWFLQDDMVYSMDSGWTYTSIYPILNYYDIRHPIFSVLLFPVYAVLKTVLDFLIPDSLLMVVLAAFIQFFHIQLLLLTGVMLRKISGHYISFWIYVVSFPTLLYILTFEKYQIIVFLIVAYVYTLWKNKKESLEIIILAIGALPTNAYLLLCEFFMSAEGKQRINRFLKIALCGVLTLFCFGRGFLFNIAETLEQLTSTHGTYGAVALTFGEKIYSVLNVIVNAFIALPSTVTSAYVWESLTTSISIAGLLLIAVIILGGVISRKKFGTKISIVWGIFPFILFVCMNWAPHESPLFAILFSWAYILLFVEGLNWLIDKVKVKREIIYVIFILSLLIVNLIQLGDIHQYLMLCKNM